MENDISRIIIETLVRETLNDIKNSPQRSIRNRVDMGLQFSTGRFHRKFFQITQTMLQNKKSSYYKLIEDLATNVNLENILKFGINIGYNSCTLGAKKIREIEHTKQFNIPWCISFYLDSKIFNEQQQKYQAIISEGEKMGIYTWMLFSNDKIQSYLLLVKEHPNSSFILFCKPEEITLSSLTSISLLNNLMIAVHYEDGVQNACHLLRKQQRLYSVYYHYTKDDLRPIINGKLFKKTQSLHPIFTALIAASNYEDVTKKKVYKAIIKARNAQKYQTLAFEMNDDIRYINQIISQDSCLVSFDSEGNLISVTNHKTTDNSNIFHTNLYNILQSAFPK